MLARSEASLAGVVGSSRTTLAAVASAARPAQPQAPLDPAQQLTARVAVTAEATTPFFALVGPSTRRRLLAVLDHLAELAELLPTSGPSWDAERHPSGALGLRFGSVALRYRVDESDGSLVIEDVCRADPPEAGP